ncbi:unnamed protein product [Owenia fusiformis]|uniref:Uncharacterized protein n=1 Tax=Owenia fusiformis TaxID=6347 RepID=A0A8S4NNT7_OWEFU|nr:unnamed protein product [Owenia fusiformis]
MLATLHILIMDRQTLTWFIYVILMAVVVCNVTDRNNNATDGNTTVGDMNNSSTGQPWSVKAINSTESYVSKLTEQSIYQQPTTIVNSTNTTNTNITPTVIENIDNSTNKSDNNLTTDSIPVTQLVNSEFDTLENVTKMGNTDHETTSAQSTAEVSTQFDKELVTTEPERRGLIAESPTDGSTLNGDRGKISSTESMSVETSSTTRVLTESKITTPESIVELINDNASPNITGDMLDSPSLSNSTNSTQSNDTTPTPIKNSTHTSSNEGTPASSTTNTTPKDNMPNDTPNTPNRDINYLDKSVDKIAIDMPPTEPETDLFADENSSDWFSISMLIVLHYLCCMFLVFVFKFTVTLVCNFCFL